MITEDYVSFEIAKLLKEKGFDEDIDLWYDENGEMFSRHKYDISGDWRVNAQQKVYLCPTLQMAMKWLREKHKITIGIVFNRNRIYYEIHQNNEFVFCVDTPKSYEKVCDEAIKYCLLRI